MKIFGPDPEKSYRDEQRDRAEMIAHLDRRAKEKEKEVLLEWQLDIDKMNAEHDNDHANYSFEATRWGDFLQIGVKRFGHRLMGGPLKLETKIFSEATALNLMGTCDISFYPGKAAGSLEPMGYICIHVEDDPYAVSADKPNGGPWRKMISRDPSEERPNYYGRLKPTHTTTYPAYAVDDRIFFHRIGVTIFAPFGLGYFVHQKILRAIKEGA